jgi:hypothetical protein
VNEPQEAGDLAPRQLHDRHYELVDVPNRAPAWRTGRKVGRTIYFQRGPEPSDDDPLVGVMDTPALAEAVVRGLNWLTAEELIDIAAVLEFL